VSEHRWGSSDADFEEAATHSIVAPGVVDHPEIDGGPTAHPELEAGEVRRLALRGFGALVLRSIGQRGLQMVGNIALFRWLAPETHGFYLILSFIVGMAGFLADLGLGASLVQRRNELNERDLRSAFTLSFGLNVLVVAVVFAVAGPLLRLYDITEVSTGAIYVLALTILAGSFTAIPSIRLERALKFTALSFADLAGSLAYVCVAVPLAYGFKDPGASIAGRAEAVWVFVWATVASRIAYTLVITIVAPWRPRFGADLRAMRRMLAFGLPYQATGFVNALKDNFIPTFIAFVAGAAAVGYVQWAVGLVTNAIVLLPIVGKVTFPAYARMQHDPAALRDAIEKSIKWVAATVFPATLLMAALARQIVEHVYGPKWFDGLPSFYLLCIPMLNAAYSTVCVSALYGLGRAKVVLRLTVVWALAGWALGVPFTLVFGMHGFAMSLSIVSMLSFMAVAELRKVVDVTFAPQLVRIFVYAALPAGVVALFQASVSNVFELAALGLAGGAGYVALMWLGGELEDLRRLMRARRMKVSHVQA